MTRHATRHFDGGKLREARKALDLTAENVARQVDVTLRTVQRWESSEGAGPSGRDLLNLSFLLGREPEFFYVETEAAA